MYLVHQLSANFDIFEWQSHTYISKVSFFFTLVSNISTTIINISKNCYMKFVKYNQMNFNKSTRQCLAYFYSMSITFTGVSINVSRNSLVYRIHPGPSVTARHIPPASPILLKSPATVCCLSIHCFLKNYNSDSVIVQCWVVQVVNFLQQSVRGD